MLDLRSSSTRKQVSQSVVVFVQSQPANLLIFSIWTLHTGGRGNARFLLPHAVAPAIMGLGTAVESAENPAAAAGPNPVPKLEATEAAMEGWYCICP